MSHESTYDLDDLLTQYRAANADSPAAAEELPRRFEPLIRSCVHLCQTGIAADQSAVCTRLLRLLGMSGPALRRKLVGFEFDDLVQECRVALLETVLANEGGKIVSNYPLQLRNRLFRLIRQQIDKLPPGMEAEIPAPVDGPEIDEAWVRGDTVELFAVLTVEERQFVKMKWHDRLFDDERSRWRSHRRTAAMTLPTGILCAIASLWPGPTQAFRHLLFPAESPCRLRGLWHLLDRFRHSGADGIERSRRGRAQTERRAGSCGVGGQRTGPECALIQRIRCRFLVCCLSVQRPLTPVSHAVQVPVEPIERSTGAARNLLQRTVVSESGGPRARPRSESRLAPEATMILGEDAGQKLRSGFGRPRLVRVGGAGLWIGGTDPPTSLRSSSRSTAVIR